MTRPAQQQPSQPQANSGQAATAAAIVALVKAQAAIRARLTAQLIAQLTASTSTFPGWYDTDAITRWATEAAATAETFQRAVATQTDAYLARTLTAVSGKPVRPVGRVNVTDLRKGVTHPGAYARAADQYRWQQAQWDRFARDLPKIDTPQPLAIVLPMRAALERVESVADADIQLAHREQTARVYDLAAKRGLITGYRRIIHPEASKGGVCGLCVAASDRLYHATEPLPIHAHCECTTLPVYNHMDPGSTLNLEDLGRMYEDAGSTSAADLKNTRYQVDEHGELGPVLNRVGKIRTSTQAKRDENKAPRKPKTPAERATQLHALRDSVAASLPRARDLAATGDPRWKEFLTELTDRVQALDEQIAA